MSKNRISKIKPAGTLDPRDEFQAKLRSFRKEFGNENGTLWCAEGLTRSEALDRHSAVLEKQLAAQTAELEAVMRKLAAVDAAFASFN